MKPKVDRVGLRFRWRLWRLGVDGRPAKVSVAAVVTVAALFVLVNGGALAKPVISMDSSQWNLYNRTLTTGYHLDKPAQAADGGVQFDLLTAPVPDTGDGYVYTSFLLNHFSGDLTGTTITATISVKTTAAVFVFNPAGGNTETSPAANVRLFFQTGGAFAFTNFWWSNPTSFVLADTGGATITLSVSVQPDLWSDYNGKLGTGFPTEFASTAATVTQLGLSFGGGFFFANGVAVSAGSATFELVGFSVS